MRYESTSLMPKEYFQQRLNTNNIYEETVASSSVDNTNSADFILVEYPGVVKNVDKALQTLGGISAIAKVFNFLIYYSLFLGYCYNSTVRITFSAR